MEELTKIADLFVDSKCNKIILSKPATDYREFVKMIFWEKKMGYQLEKYTKTQVFHENLTVEETREKLKELLYSHYLQGNGFSIEKEIMVMVSKKGKITIKEKKNSWINTNDKENNLHNRKKNYILEEGTYIAPLVDMGIFTTEGKVIASMYDKYKQINRFIEIIDDSVRTQNLDSLNIIDFGCGKSYLTFILYYYLTQIKNKKVNIIGLDLKREVIQKCNETAARYGYENLHFQVGDIVGYQSQTPVDMVVTLHACDTATDFALYHAIGWGAKMIFSVPCCQHELNQQMEPENLDILKRYGILQERFAAIATDGIRANLLEYCGYKTQLLEFVDFSSTPKNLLIRATKKNSTTSEHKRKMLTETIQLMEEFHFKPMLYGLLDADDRLG